MKRLTFETTMLLILVFCVVCLIVSLTFMMLTISDIASGAKQVYTVTQNDASYVGSIIRGDDYIKVIGKDNNMVILDAAHGPISIRRSDLEEYPIDVQQIPGTNL
jgi:hypothetical protein